MGFWPVVLDLIRNADILVVLGDARLPEMSINRELIDKIEYLGKPYVLAFSKRDLLSDEVIKDVLKKYPGCFVVSGPKNLGVGNLRRELQIIAKRYKFDEPRIAVVGYPNLGKSALINALARRKNTLVSNVPGTTRGVQWVKSGNMRILDSPGVIPFEDKNRRLVLIGSKSAEQVRNPEKYCLDIIQLFLEKNPQKLKEYFKLPSLTGDSYEVFLEIGKARLFLKKGGEVDEDRTARTIIREWQSGKLGI